MVARAFWRSDQRHLGCLRLVQGLRPRHNPKCLISTMYGQPFLIPLTESKKNKRHFPDIFKPICLIDNNKGLIQKTDWHLAKTHTKTHTKIAHQFHGICSNLQMRQNSNTQTETIMSFTRGNIFSDCTHSFCSLWCDCLCLITCPRNEVRLMFASLSRGINKETDVFGLEVIE